MRFTFEQAGTAVAAVVPPTYLHARETARNAQEVLAVLLAPEGYRAAPALLPKKLLAVRSGLATYGRNNITYIPGMGSFHRLSAFYMDKPPEGDDWQELKMMGRCYKCHLCHTLCPAGAIVPDRFMVRAERCIVFHNEKPGTMPFPSWLRPSWHNCLVSCMQCQRLCPENHGNAQRFTEGCGFSVGETGLLLAGTPINRIPVTLAKKLKEQDLAESLDILPRNMTALLNLAK